MATVTRLALAAVLSVAAFAPATAFADDDEEMPPMAPAGPPPVYTAPLSQTTQPTYVPQSVALSGPEEIEDYDFSRPIPAGYTVVKRKRLGMLIGGGVTFGVSYGYALLFAAAGHDEAQGYDYDGSGGGKNELAALAIPVAGPFLQMAETESATLRLVLGGLGAAQMIGAVMLYKGLTTKKSVLVRNDLVGNMTLVPMAGGGATGMLLSGQF